MTGTGEPRGGEFLVPDLGEGLEDVTVTQWEVALGDEVALNQVLCTVETAKAAVEIPSPVAGRVRALGGAVGDVLPVGALLVRFEATGTARWTSTIRRPIGSSSPRSVTC
ncbi:biotin/lipoyl-containing protein, partial [Mycolicibacterium fallax]|uniref:biotin/lipoyl-containing protein n=1 Tax=Mycolicibacterium fallax TaxID=1793 RepID=UPI0027E2ADA4